MKFKIITFPLLNSYNKVINHDKINEIVNCYFKRSFKNSNIISINKKIKVQKLIVTNEQKNVFNKFKIKDLFNPLCIKVFNLQKSDKKKENVMISNKNTEINFNKNLFESIKLFLKLTKPKLTVLVILSSVCSYSLSPNILSVQELIFLTSGTAFCSGSANAFNMAREPDFDKKMIRTANRPIVKGLIKSINAYSFGIFTGTIGVMLLYFGVNSIVSVLGLFNIILYSWIYTSLKRYSILNTWVGAIVGSIPPLMGWAASSLLSMPSAWCLAGILYAWQFPHFNSLSHKLANQYKKAGFFMTSFVNPLLNARVSFTYSLMLFPLCFGLYYFKTTDIFFLIDSSIINGRLSFLAYQFWKIIKEINSKSTKKKDFKLIDIKARKLFWFSIWHLPLIFILAMIHKKDQWIAFFNILDFN